MKVMVTNTNTANTSPLSKATIKTLKNLLPRLSSNIDLLASVCTTKDEDCMPTLPPVAVIKGIKNAKAVTALRPSSKNPINPAPNKPPTIPINSQGRRALESLYTESVSSTSSEIPVMACISSSTCSLITSKISSTVILPTNLFLTLTTGTASKSYFRMISATSSWSI